MPETAEQNAAREQILEALSVAGDVVETCVLAGELLANHEPVGSVCMISADTAQTLINALNTAGVELRKAIDDVCERLQQLPVREE